MIIKVLLIAGIVGVTLYLLRGRSSARHLAFRRLASLAFAASGVAAILAPGAVTAVANSVGVGRGTDLVLYLVVIAFLFATVSQHQRMRDLEDRIAHLTRELALRDHERGRAAHD